MNAKRLWTIVFIVLVLVTDFVTTQAQGGTPHPPNLVSPGNGSTITSSNNIQLCASPSDDMTSEIRFEVFQAPIPDFQTPYQGGNPVCYGISVPNGHYTWHARGKNSAGEGGASPDWVFTIQVGDAQPPTRIPGPEGPTAVPDMGPSFNWSFNPGANATVGSNVTISVSVNSSNPGATKISVACGGVDKPETSEVRFDSHWNTSGCSGGNQTVMICSRSVSDQQWQRANCQSQAYPLSGNSNQNAANADFWADSYQIQTGQCTTMHWRTTNATSVDIDGNGVGAAGDQQICPNVTKKYSLRATNPNGDATRNFTVQVSMTNIPAASSSASGGGPQVGSAYVPGMVPSNAKQPGVPGGVDLIKECYAKGFSNADNSNGGSNGWYCSGGPNGERWDIGNNWGPICVDVYGVGYTAINPGNTKDGWRCVQGNTSQPQQPQPQPQPPVNQAPQTNALGQPLAVNSNGDTVYPKAAGSGGNLCVKNDINSLYLRTSSETGSQRNIIGTMTAGNCYQLLQVVNGWAQVTTSLGNGWVKANPDWVTLQSQPAVQQPPAQQPQVQQPAVQNPAPNQGKQVGDQNPNLGCGDLGFTNLSGGVNAASCVNYIKISGLDQGLIRCLQDHGWKTDENTGAAETVGAANTWGKYCNVVAIYPADKLDLANIAGKGSFLVVWGSYCMGKDKQYEAGHIAYFQSYSNGTIVVDDENDPPNTPGGPNHSHSFPDSQKVCTTIIQLGGVPIQVGGNQVTNTPNKQNGQTQDQVPPSVTAVRAAPGLCILCTPKYWINFYLPSWKYDEFNFRLTFLGKIIPYEYKELTTVWFGTDTLTFQVSSANIQRQIDAGNGDKLSDPKNWVLYYIAK